MQWVLLQWTRCSTTLTPLQEWAWDVDALCAASLAAAQARALPALAVMRRLLPDAAWGMLQVRFRWCVS